MSVELLERLAVVLSPLTTPEELAARVDHDARWAQRVAAEYDAWEAIVASEASGETEEIRFASPALIAALDSIVIDCDGDRLESEDAGDFPGLYVDYSGCTDAMGEGQRVTWQVRAWLRDRLPHEQEEETERTQGD